MATAVKQEHDEMAFETTQNQKLYPDLTPRLISLFQRIQRRGLDPLLPSSYKLDFPGLPLRLFVSDSVDARYGPIRSIRDTEQGEVRAKIALGRIFMLGVRVRERIELNREMMTSQVSRGSSLRYGEGVKGVLSVEGLIVDELKRFVSWVKRDAGIKDDTLRLFLTIVSPSVFGRTMETGLRNHGLCDEYEAGASKETHEWVAAKLESKIRNLASSHRVTSTKHAGDETVFLHLQSVRTVVYGVAVAGPKIALVAQGCENIDMGVRNLIVVDLRERGGDVWSALAVVLVILAARDERLAYTNPNKLQNELDVVDRFSKMKVDYDDNDDDDDDVDA